MKTCNHRSEMLAGGIALLALLLTTTAGCSGSASPNAISVPGLSATSCTLSWSAGTGTPSFGTEAAAQDWASAQADPNAGAGFGNAPSVAEFASLSVTTSQTIDIYDVTVAFYTASGTEISSADATVNETLTPGQSWSQTGSLTAPTGTASCKVIALPLGA